MATFAGMGLLLPQAPAGGGVFYLLQPSTESATQPLAGGQEVEVATGVRAVVVRGVTARSYEDALAKSLARAQEGLDLLSARGVVSAAIADVDAEHLAWWDAATGTTIRFWGAARLTVTTGLITIKITEPDGTERPDPGPLTTWHGSMRYFRQAQVTGDLFDAFRSLYLALESVLSTICPMAVRPSGEPDESERAWFRRALAVAAARVDLRGFAKTPPTPGTTVVDELLDELYQTVRTSVFHAKAGRPVLLPHDLAARGAVLDVLERLANLYLALLEAVTGVRFARGGIFAGFFRRAADAMPMDQLHLTDDESPMNEADSQVRVADGKSMVTLPLTAAPELSETWFSARQTSCAVGDIADRLPYISKLVTSTRAREPGIAFTLEGRLDPRGLDRFEAVIGPRAVNARMPRTRYLT